MANTPKSIHITAQVDTDEVRAAILRAKAEAWEDGYQDGLIDGNYAIAARIERGASKRIPNPYGEIK